MVTACVVSIATIFRDLQVSLMSDISLSVALTPVTRSCVMIRHFRVLDDTKVINSLCDILFHKTVKIPDCLTRYRLSTYGRRAFSVAGPTVWNSLPENIQDPECSVDSYRQSLKTFLSSQYYCVQRIRGLLFYVLLLAPYPGDATGSGDNLQSSRLKSIDAYVHALYC